jgi:hypothetical protein
MYGKSIICAFDPRSNRKPAHGQAKTDVPGYTRHPMAPAKAAVFSHSAAPKVWAMSVSVLACMKLLYGRVADAAQSCGNTSARKPPTTAKRRWRTPTRRRASNSGRSTRPCTTTNGPNSGRRFDDAVSPQGHDGRESPRAFVQEDRIAIKRARLLLAFRSTFPVNGASVAAMEALGTAGIRLCQPFADREAIAIGLERLRKVALRDLHDADPLVRHRQVALPLLYGLWARNHS